MLEKRSYQDALRQTIEKGDPNEVAKVFKHLLQLAKGHKSQGQTNDRNNPKTSNVTLSEVVSLVGTVPDGFRHLRNYCKKRMRLPQYEDDMTLVLNELYS